MASLVCIAGYAPDVDEDESALGCKTPSALDNATGAIRKRLTPVSIRLLFQTFRPQVFPLLRVAACLQALAATGASICR